MGCCISVKGKPQEIEIKTYVRPHAPRKYGVIPEIEYPPPSPPSDRKTDRYQGQLYSNMDKYSSKVPEKLLETNLQDLADFITRQAKTEVECARAVFRYVTSLDLTSIQIDPSSPPNEGSVLESLVKIKTHQSNHAFFFRDLARLSGLICVVIKGISKNSYYDVGQALDEKALSCQWNAVHIDGQWRLIDAFWGSTCVVGHRSEYWHIVNVDGECVNTEEEAGVGINHKRRNDFYFLTDPDMLVCTHFPNDLQWQLLPHPVTKSEFKEFVYVREQFFELGLYMLEDSHQSGVLNADDGEIIVTFGITPDPDPTKVSHEFSYLLFAHREGLKKTKVKIENNVIYELKHDKLQYTVWFPMAGEFRMDIFGRRVANEDDEEEHRFDLACSYAIKCTRPHPSLTAIPDSPEIGWGPGAHSSAVGLQPITHQAGIIKTDNSNVQIRFKQKSELNLGVALKCKGQNSWELEKYILARSEDGELIVDVRLPQDGTFALELFAADPQEKGELPNVCNYLIQYKASSQQGDQPFPIVPGQILGPAADTYTIQKPQTAQRVEGVIHTSDGKVSLNFKSADSENILTQLNHTGKDDTDLHKHITKSVRNKQTLFDIHLPDVGEYAFNVYSRQNKQSQRLHHTHSYLIKYNFDEIRSASHEQHLPQIHTITCHKHPCEIRCPKSETPNMFSFFSKCANEELSSAYIKHTEEEDEDVYNLMFPRYGQYSFLIFTSTSELLKQTATYHINFSYQEETAEDRSQKMTKNEESLLRIRLKMAIVSGSFILLKKALKKCEKEKLREKDGDLTRAKATLLFLQVSKDLKSAIQSRERRKLEKAIQAVEKNNFVNRMIFELIMARRILVDVLKDKIRQMDQGTIAEVKSYQAPPPAVLSVMQAAFTLLGQGQSTIKDWEALRGLIGDTNKMKMKLKEKTATSISDEEFSRARDVLTGVDGLQIGRVSEVAETFYAWTTNMLKLKEENNSVSAQRANEL